MRVPSHFYSCDWGTTNFRLRLVATGSLAVVAEHTDENGVQAIARAGVNGRAERYSAHLCAVLEKMPGKPPERESPVVVSGMASSSLGWSELPYAQLPLALDGGSLPVEEKEAAGRRVLLISGACTDADVMRGEETELVGLRSLLPDPALWKRTCVVLPGTHTKHAVVRDGVLTGFHTHLTGELFAWLVGQSILGHSVERCAWSETWREVLAQGAAWGARHGVGGGAFRVRARRLLDAADPRANYWFLSGVVLGAELAQLPVDLGGIVLLAASGELAAAYGAVLAAHRPGILVPPEAILHRRQAAGHRAVLLHRLNSAA